MRGRCGRSDDASLLPLRRHSEHGIKNGEQWKGETLCLTRFVVNNSIVSLV